ncbi:MAG: hypothetical protein ACRD2F_03290 [Terriglobales bacterium]
MEEHDFFTEKTAAKPAKLVCPFCRTEQEHALIWIVRTKKAQLPPRADAVDRARFAKMMSYMVRRDDKVACANPRCGKRFEVSGVQSIVELG